MEWNGIEGQLGGETFITKTSTSKQLNVEKHCLQQLMTSIANKLNNFF